MVIIATGQRQTVRYFQAVQAGKKRANDSQMKLFRIAGFAMLTLTTKKVDGEFMPVGQEDFAAVIQKGDEFIAIIVDEDGFTKAQTKALETREEAAGVYKKLRESGMDGYPGREIRIWTESYPAIQTDLQ